MLRYKHLKEIQVFLSFSVSVVSHPHVYLELFYLPLNFQFKGIYFLKLTKTDILSIYITTKPKIKVSQNISTILLNENLKLIYHSPL